MSTDKTLSDEQKLDSLLKDSKDRLLPDELTYLITAFLPSQPTIHRSKAYLVLASFCQGVRSSAPPTKPDENDPATDSLSKVFIPLVVSRLAEQTENDALVGISFLAALFQVDWQSASAIFQQDGIVDFVMDALDLFPSPSLCLEVAHLFGQAGGHKLGRAALSSQCIEWLESQSRQTTDSALRAAAAMALVKLSRGGATDGDGGTGVPEQNSSGREAELVKLMKALVVDGGAQSSLSDAIEGLAYLSVDPAVKETLSKDPSFLTKLFALVPRRKRGSQVLPDYNPTLIYGLLLIVSNLCAYKPRLTEEQAQIAKLRRMANAGKKQEDGPGADPLEDDEHTKERGHRLIKAGVLDVLTAAVSLTDSHGVRVVLSKAYLALVEDKENRGKILQSGGAKSLMLIIKKALSSESSKDTQPPSLDTSGLEAIQTLAKLAITASPVQVFGPNVGATFDAIRPLSLLLMHNSATLLQRFEAMMALTNLASLSAEAAARIAQVEGLLSRIELLLLEEHVLVRRAAIELVCNLIAGSDQVFERYGGTEDLESGAIRSKVQVLLALSDVDDLPTRLAASGALATVTNAPGACGALLSLHRERHRVLPVFVQLIDPSAAPPPGDEETEDEGEAQSDPGLTHRGVICTRNFLLSIEDVVFRKEVAEEAERVGLVAALVGVVKNRGVDASVLRPAAEGLKALISTGAT